MSSRLTRAGGFRHAVMMVGSSTISAAPRVSGISIPPSRIAARSTTASISRRLSDAIAEEEAIAAGYDTDDAAERDSVERRPVAALAGVPVSMDHGNVVFNASVGAAKSRGAVAGNPISLSAPRSRGPRRLNQRFEST